MLLIVFLILGLLIGMFRGGGLSGLLKIRGVWLILIAVAAERSFLFLPGLLPQLFPTLTMVLQLVRFLPLFVFILLNLKDWRLCLAGLGIALNFAAIAANNWQMPIHWDAPLVQGLERFAANVQNGITPEYMIMGTAGGANLWFFADIIPLNFISTFPMGFMSAGDVLLGVGLMLSIQHAMARHSKGKHARGSHAKHLEAKHSRRERRLPAERPVQAGKPAAVIPEKQALKTEQHPLEKEPVAVPEAESVQSMPTAVIESPLEPPPVVLMPEPLPPPLPQEEPELLEILPARDFSGGEESIAEIKQEDAAVKLSPRLEAVAGLVTRRAVVADVGCDHGKLAVWLAMNGAVFVVAMDVSAKSLAKTKKLVGELGLQHAVQTRVSDGLKKLKAGEADVIVIAGLGGPSICSILRNGYNVAQSAARLVLQPMNAVGEVRRWLVDNGFSVAAEELAQEDGRIYQILAAEPGADPRPPMSLFDLEVGRLLIENRHPLLPKLLQSKIDTIDTILMELEGNGTARAEARRSELTTLKDRCAEVLKSL